MKHKKTRLNIIGFGVQFKAGSFYQVQWYAGGEHGFNEVCHIPADTKYPKKFFKDWLREITQFITLPTIDIHIKEVKVTK